MQTFKIGFGYRAESGKDTACRAIVRTFGDLFHVRHYGFADALRSEVAGAAFDQWVQDWRDLPFDAAAAMEHLCRWAGVSYDPNAPVSAGYPFGKQRALYQWWGTEYRRGQDEYYWVKRLAERIEREQPAYAVISDVRFANEFLYCDYRIRLDRPNYAVFHENRTMHRLEGSVGDHISERVLDCLAADDWDAVIEARSVNELERKTLALFRGRFEPPNQSVLETCNWEHLKPCA